MARSGGRQAAEVDFSDRRQAEAWFRRQPREVSIAVTVRSALRILPIVETARGASNFASHIALPVRRACFVAWVIARYPSQSDRLRSLVTAVNTEAVMAVTTATNYEAAAAATINSAVIPHPGVAA